MEDVSVFVEHPAIYLLLFGLIVQLVQIGGALVLRKQFIGHFICLNATAHERRDFIVVRPVRRQLAL